MAKGTIQLQQLATQIFATIKGFSDDRYTGQVQFHVTMNQGGVSRAAMLTQSAFGYQERDLQPQEEEMPIPPSSSGGYRSPSISLIASMSQKE